MKFSPLICCLSLIFGYALSKAQETRLSNLSIRAQGGGGDALITGFTIGPGASKTVLIRAVGPTLGVFGVEGVLSDPKLVLYNNAGAKIAENDDFLSSDAAAFASVGAFQLAVGGKDAALVATLAPGSYTAEVTGGGAARGVALVEVYEVSAGATRLVNLSTRAQVGTGDGILIPGITISAGSPPRRLLIRAIGPTLGGFGVAGVIADPKLELYAGATKIAENDNWETPVGVNTVAGPQLTTLFGRAGAFALAGGSKDAALLADLAPGNYTLQVSGVGGATGEALVEVYDLSEPAGPAVSPNSNLYFAQLRPGPGAAGSTASGFAAISIQSDGTALVNVNISNLSSGQTAAYLRLSGASDAIFSLPRGQVIGSTWTIGPVGIYTRNDIVRALNEGRLYVSLETAKYPAGEVEGQLVSAAGSRSFNAPTVPPTLPNSLLLNPGDVDAARLLIQATFGATEESIAEVRRLGMPEWIRAQQALPATSLRTGMIEDGTKFPNPSTTPMGEDFAFIGWDNFSWAWWKIMLTAPDQLRQRVAFALSQILVISFDGTSGLVEPMSQYHDILASEAFGNYRTLLERVSLHPEMGWYLTYLRNQKADQLKGTSPDENYAREVHQLFTVGLVQLQPDGTLLLDAQGLPIPTYDNITITETAKVFTGWAYQNLRNDFFADPQYGEPGGFSNRAPFAPTNGRMLPLKSFEAYHDKTEKRVIGRSQLPPRLGPPTIIPANQTGAADLKILLDALVDHPNTGPFLSRQLIQRLVTSNPSPGYVYRVAQTFANDGTGTRGNLGAVVRAILTDYEARAGAVTANVGFGKIKEPILRLTALMRMLKTAAPNGRFADTYFLDPRGGGFYPAWTLFAYGVTRQFVGQAPYRSPSVFNFYSPFYSPPGALADAGLVAPEMQIVDSSLAIKAPNQFIDFIYKQPPVLPNEPVPSPILRHDFSSLLALSPQPSALIDRLNLLLCGGQLTSATRQILEQELGAIPVLQAMDNYSGAKPAAFSPTAGLAAPKVAAFDAGAKFTIEAWVFPTVISTTGWSFIAGKRGDSFGVAGTYGLSNLILNPGGRVGFEVHDGTLNSNRGVQSTVALAAGVWTHLALTYDGAVIRLYLNGTQNAQANAIVIPPSRPEMPFSIGEGVQSNGNAGLSAFNGLISQARFWNVPRTAAQIQQGMREGIPSEKTGLVANWLLDEGSGLSAKDSSGNGYDLGPRTATSGVNWAVLSGQSLDRVRTALQLTILSADAAIQK